METRSRHRLGTVVFLVGVALGVILAALAVWADFEAVSYFYTGAGYAGFSGLRCPVLLSRGEIATVSARLNNASNEEAQPYYQVEISGIAGTRKIEDQVIVPPHSSKSVQLTVTDEDIDLGSFVMVRMDILPMAGYSTRETTCGMLVLPLGGLSDGQFVGGLLVLSLLGIVAGLFIREAGPAPVAPKDVGIRNEMRATGVCTCLALFAALSGSWLFGFLLCAVTVLLLVILLRMAVS